MSASILRARPSQGKGQSTRPPFSAVPHDLIRDRRLIPTDVAVVAALLVFARAGSSCWPSAKTVAAEVGRCRRTVQMSFARLRAAGWIGERPADNTTGREILLLWRTPPAQPAPSRPAQRAAPDPAQSVAAEWKNQNEKEVYSPIGKPRTPTPRVTLTAAEIESRYLGSGWLERAPGDPLRRLAERHLMAARGAPPEALGGFADVSAAKPPASPRPAPRRPWRGPQRLFP